MNNCTGFRRLIYLLPAAIMLLCCSFTGIEQSSSVLAEKAVLMGLVRDGSSKEALPGVTVAVSMTQGVNTDSAGRYSIDLKPGTYTVTFSFIGYTSQSRKVVVNGGEAMILNIDLLPAASVLNTVVVSAGKFEQRLDEVTVSMEVLPSQLIRNTNTTNVETAVELVPGVVVTDGQANIRAGSGYSYGAGSRVQVLIDEMPALAADANDVKWSFVPVEKIAQVEVIKGAASALFGSSAMNGVINIRTLYPGDKPETRVTAFYGWYGDPGDAEMKWWEGKVQHMHGLNFSHTQRSGPLDLVFSGYTLSDQGYRQGEGELRYRLTGSVKYNSKKIKGLATGIGVNVTAADGGNFFIWQNDTSGAYIPQGGIGDSTTISYYQTTRTAIDPFLTYATAKGTVHKLRGRYFRSSNVNNTNQQSFATLYYGEYLFQKKVAEILTASAGVVEQYSVVESELYEDHISNNIGIYAQADMAIGKFNFSVGGRLESNHIDGEDPETIPVIRSGMNYRIAKFTTMRASYGQGYRYPSIAEKFIRTNVGDINIYPNDTLKSETGWTAEFGIKQGFRISSWMGFLDIAAFRSEYEDMMEFVFGQYGLPTDPFFGLGFQSQNIGNTRITGIDITLAGSGKIGSVPVSILTGYTYADPVQLDFDAAKDTLKNTADYNVLKYRYRHTFKADAEMNPGKWMLGMSALYYSRMENIDKVFEVFIPGVEHYRDTHPHGDWVFDARAGYRVNEQFSASVIVKNIFNRVYATRPADMQAPVNYTVQMSLVF